MDDQKDNGMSEDLFLEKLYRASAEMKARISGTGVRGRPGPARPVREGRFGDFDATNTGADLTLEWDSNDPDLHTCVEVGDQSIQDEAAASEWEVEESGLPVA